MSVEKLDIKHVRQAQKSFTTHLNTVLQNVKDAFALGVYTYLSSLPHDWVVNRNHLMKHFNVGRDKIKSTMAWLNVHHLIDYEQERNSDNTFGKSLIIVKDGTEFVEYILNYQQEDAGGLKSRPAEAGGLKTRRTENPLDGKSAPTYINIKDTKEIKDKKAKTEIPSWLDSALWNEFVLHRKQIKKPMTVLAENRILKKLTELRQQGQDYEAILNKSILSGWTDIFPIRPIYEIKKQPAANSKQPETRSIVPWFGNNH